MKERERSAIIISASSDIGYAMCQRWISRGLRIYGTYRTLSHNVEKLRDLKVNLVYCDLSDLLSIENACLELKTICPQWDVLVLCPGMQEPVNSFIECSFDEWERSLTVNFVSQMRIVHYLLPFRCSDESKSPYVLFFAGGGTNSAPVRCSAYTISKIALIKMCELLDAEIDNASFIIVGPGWVKTKIHESTLRAGANAGDNYQRTLDKLNGDECTQIDEVLNCFDWLIDAPRKAVSGRNFSVVFDKWGDEALIRRLLQDKNMYKLRRFGNDSLIK